MTTDPLPRARLLVAIMLACVLLLLGAIAFGWYPAARSHAASYAELSIGLQGTGSFGLRD
jgi:hypothetical protein